MESLKYDVMIIGYGAVGKTIANLLGKKGWNVGVFERYPTPYGLPRAIKYDHEITRIFQSVVPVDEIKRISVKIPDHYVWVNSENKSLLEIDWSQDGISGWPSDMLFNQAELEEILDDAVKQYENVDVRLGYNAIHLTETEESVEVMFKTTDGKIVKAVAEYVMGSDGANSFVRDNMEHSVTDLGFYSDFLVVDIIPKKDMEFSPMNFQVCDPKRPTTVASGGPGRRRWEFMLLPGETREDFQDEAIVWELLKEWDVTPENATLERFTVYTFKAKWVEQWRKGRLILAGDSAHLTPPFLGQGLSSGIRDAINIYWKLDHVLSGVSDESLLDLYTVERKPHMIKLIEGAVYLGKIICITDEEEARKRDEAFLSGNYPPFPGFPTITDGIVYQPGENQLAGQLSLQAVVERNGKTDLFDKLIGDGWMVIGLDQEPADYINEYQKQDLEKLGTKFIKISTSQTGEILDIEGKYDAFFKEHNIEALVVRPDFNIYAGISKMAQLGKVVDNLLSTVLKPVAVS